MSILLEASFTSYYVHTVLNFQRFPPTQVAQIVYLHIPFIFTVHVTLVHNMIAAGPVRPAPPALLVSALTPNECPAGMALRS